jgi:hypothetical protein
MPPPIREKERAAILSSLGAGVVPSIGLHHIQVGRKSEINAILNDLARIEQGGAAVRFVVGRFGSGKSFFPQPSTNRRPREEVRGVPRRHHHRAPG